MITGIAILLACIITGMYFKNQSTSMRESMRSGKGLFDLGAFWKGLLIFASLFIGSLIQPYTLERVDAGHVGILVKLAGDDRGISKYEYKTGWVVVNGWFSRLYEFPIYQQHIDYNTQTIITKGGFSATIRPSFNYSIKAGDVGDMFQNLRISVQQVEQSWLQTAIVGSVNDVANRWNVDSIFNHRQEFEAEIVKEANLRVQKWFIVSQLRTNIVPPEALKQSIEAKTRAIQEVQVAENQKQVAIAQGQKMVAEAMAEAQRKTEEAKGDSAQSVIKAAGEAEAIKKVQMSLSNSYIQYQMIQKWNGTVPTTQLGDKCNFLLQVK